MGYTNKAYAAAENILSARRRQSIDLLNLRQQELNKNSRFVEIENLITEKGIELSRLALKKGAIDTEKFSEIERDISKLEKEKNEILSNSNYSVHFCNECNDTGYINGEMCHCFKTLLSEYDYKLGSEIPHADFSDFDLDLYSNEIIPHYNISAREQMETVFDYCKDYAENFSPASDNVLMVGGAGRGKTLLCGCIAGVLVKKGFTVIMKSAYNVFETISKNKFDFKNDFNEDIASLYNCDLLILDDLGTEFVTDYTTSALFDIINTRLNSGKPMIITANLSLQDMSSKYSDRIVSRLLTYKHLLFLGSDIRALRK